MIEFGRFKESLQSFKNSKIFKGLMIVVLLIAIALGVVLTVAYQTLNSNASSGEVTRIEAFGPSISNGVTNSRNINLRLIYVPNTTALRASLLDALSPVKTAYAAATCNPLGGVDPKTWVLIEKYTCDPGNPGTAGEEWACFGSDGKPKAVKFSNDISDTNRCPLPAGAPAPIVSSAPSACLPGCCGGAGNECGSCPNGQICRVSNGACQSGLSCDPQSCTYSQQDPDGVHCYSGICTGADCGFNKSCKYDPATTKRVDCTGASSSPAPASGGGGFALQILPITSTSTAYGIQIDIRDNQKIPTAAQLAKLHPQWVRFAFPCINSQANSNSCPKDYHSTNLIGSIPPGVKQLAVITGDTTWNAPIGSLDDSQWKKYIDSTYIPTLQKIVADYGSNLSAIELWNEEDLNAGQSYDPYIPASSYGYLVSKAIPAIRAINPNIQIVSGGLASGQSFYLDQAIKASGGAFQNIDAIAIHPYETPDQIGKITTDMTNLYTVLSQDGINKPVWVTEIGIENFSSSTSPKNPAEFLQEAFSQFQSVVPEPAMVNWYAFVDSMTGGNGSNDWGLYDNLGNLKATGVAFSQYGASYTPHAASTKAQAIPVYPTSFRIANSLTELSLAPEQPFDQNNKEISWTLTPGNGSKTVYAQFKVSGAWADIASTTITLAEQGAAPQNATSSAGLTQTASGSGSANSSSAPLIPPSPQNAALVSPKSQFDLNGDGKVDSSDASMFIKIWQSGSNTKVADFNGDGKVNAIDFGILLKNIALP